MKVLLVTDNEGVCGVALQEDVESPAARAQLTAEVNAAIDGIFSVAPGSQVLVLDGHGGGYRGLNVSRTELHPAARLLNGKRGVEMPLLALGEEFDAVFAVGAHARAGTAQAVLNHTISSDRNYNVYLHGAVIGEPGLWAALAGERGIPLVFVAGDHWACAEIKALLPHVETAAVKKGLNRFCAVHLDPAQACALIRAGAARAARGVGAAVVYRVPTPVEVRVDYLTSDLADAAAYKGATRVGDRTVVITAASVAEALPRI